MWIEPSLFILPEVSWIHKLLFLSARIRHINRLEFEALAHRNQHVPFYEHRQPFRLKDKR